MKMGSQKEDTRY